MPKFILLLVSIISISFSLSQTGPCSDPVCDSINWVVIMKKLGYSDTDLNYLYKGQRVDIFSVRCNIDTFPEEIGNLTALQKLTIGSGLLESTYSLLKHLPASIGNLTNLQYLDVSKNQLEELPPEIGRLVNLKTLRLSRNNLRTLPDSIVRIVNLDRWWDVPGYQLEIGWNHICSLPPAVEMWVDTMLGVNYVGRGDWKVTQCNDCPKGQMSCGTAIKQPLLTQPAYHHPEIPSQLFDLHGKQLKLPVEGGIRRSLPKGCYIIRSGNPTPYFRRYVVP